MKRRDFIAKTSQSGIALSLLGVYGCIEKKSKDSSKLITEDFQPFFKLSLAQWSFHKAIRTIFLYKSLYNLNRKPFHDSIAKVPKINHG